MPKRRPKLAAIDPDVTQAWSPKAEWGDAAWEDASGQQQSPGRFETVPLPMLHARRPRPDTFPALEPERLAGIPRFGPAGQQPAPDTDPAPIATRLAAAADWTDVFLIGCEHPAAPHETPIPCGTPPHRDDTAGSFSALRKSAHAAGWRMDAFGRMCCPDCAQDKPLHTLYPVTFWAEGAADARDEGVMYRNQVTGREWPLEFTLTVFAEMRSIEEVSEARAGGGRHRAVTA